MTNHFTTRSALLVPILMVVLALPGTALASGGPPNPPKPVVQTPAKPAECTRVVDSAIRGSFAPFGVGDCVRKGSVYITFQSFVKGDGSVTVAVLLSKGTSSQSYSLTLGEVYIGDGEHAYRGCLYSQGFALATQTIQYSPSYDTLISVPSVYDC